jgi:HAD superfamily hydrolase (TIGR01450 family)
VPADRRYDGFAIDLDGVVWLGHEPIVGSAEAIERLRAAGHPLVFVTNDPRSTRAELAERLGAIGAPTDRAQVLTSAVAAAEEVARTNPGAAVLAVGTESLATELAAQGLQPMPIADGIKPAAVVVGGGAPYDQDVVRIASTAVREGARLIATNKDPLYPTTQGLVPGTGSLVAAIEVPAGVEAENAGKPEPALFEAALRHLDCKRPLMAGDSLHSDIAGATRAGMETALILSGRDSRADLAAAPQAPQLVFENLAALAEALA